MHIAILAFIFIFYYHVYLSHQNKKKKRKVDFECHAFKSSAECGLFVLELNDKAFCLLRNDSIAMIKEYNIHQHY